jgi:DNA-binding transcriptional ArsR family regulator
MMEAEAEKGLSTPSPFPYVKESKMKVELDKKALLALASDSRMEILKALHPQRRTVAQLADHLGIDKAAVFRHLKKLEEGELVMRQEDHGFVYYGLTWKARDVISPGENTKIVIVFSLSFLLVVGAVSSFLMSMTGPSYGGGETYPAGEPSIVGPDSPGFSGISVSPELLLLAIVLGVLGSATIYLAWRYLRRPKQKASPKDGTVLPWREDIAD